MRLSVPRIFYLLAIVVAFYLLSISRSGEVHTVWEVMHPAFIPTFLVATFILFAIIFSHERVEYKLFFAILHSILSHTFMVIIFPAGNVGVQQWMLGQSRLVFDNVISHGFGWAVESIPLKMYISFRGENFQTAFSVLFARMFGIDVYWTHLLLVPLLWGTFVPVVAFMMSKALGASENVSVLSSLVVSLFPANILWGAASIPNGLSYLFFFCFIYFVLKYIKFDRAKDLFLVATFFFASFISHYLAGTIALSLLLLANSIRTYEKGKSNSPLSAKLTLLISLVFSASILPFALAYRRLFYPWANTFFSLENLSQLPLIEITLSLLLGSYFDLMSREAYITTLIFGIAPILGIIGMTYILRTSVKKTPKKSVDPRILFLFLGFLMIIVSDRIVKYFMINVPFSAIERLWLFRDFLLVPFVALVIAGAINEIRALFDNLSKNVITFLRKTSSFFQRPYLIRGAHLGSIFAYVLTLTIVSGWVTASVYYAYPHWGPLQTTSYELEAVKHIQETTKEKYVVIADQWIIFAGQMFVGINNPQAFYFSHTDPDGISLYIQMKTNPTNQTLEKAMEYNNATTAYFIIEKPRLGTGEYNRIVAQAEQNGLQTYPEGIFYYQGEEKLRIFYYKK